MNPTPTPSERAEAHERPARSRVQYPWHLIKLGEWQEWQKLGDEVSATDARADAARLRAAAHSYARSHGLTVGSVTTRKGHTVDLRFDRKGSAS